MEEDERDDRVKERDGEGEGGRVDRMRGGKKRSGSVRCFAPVHFFLTAGIKHVIFGEKTAQREKREAAGSLRDWCSGQTAAQRDHG